MKQDLLDIPRGLRSYARRLGAVMLPRHSGATPLEPTRAESERHAARRARFDGWEGEGGSLLPSRGPKLPL